MVRPWAAVRSQAPVLPSNQNEPGVDLVASE
jgi:hypothetical protein